MSKNKFFSLIYGDIVEKSPESKIIPAESFSKLIDASEILEHVHNDVEKYKREVVSEIEAHKASAESEGYEEGLKKWADHLVKLEEEIKSVHAELQKTIIPVALKAAKKIVAKEIELDPEVIKDIVASTLKAVSQHKKISIYVNKNDLETLEKNKPELRNIFESLEAFSIREREDVKPGGCVVETEIGIINAQLEHRWHVLEKAFEKLANNQAKAK